MTFESESQVSGGTDQTAAVEEEDCPEDEEGAAAEGAAVDYWSGFFAEINQELKRLKMESRKHSPV